MTKDERHEQTRKPEAPRRHGRFRRGKRHSAHPCPRAGAAEGPFKLPPLGYANDALEPHIDAQTMMIHHDRHHAAYVNVCNQVAKEVPALGTTPIEQTLADPAYIPLQLQQTVKEQSRRPLEPHVLLGADEAGRRQGAGQRAEVRDRRLMEGRQRVQGTGERRGRRTLRLRLGLAGRQQGQEAGADLDGEPGHADRRSAPRP